MFITLRDLTYLLNKQALRRSQLHNISLSAQGTQLKLRGTLDKGVPLPVEVIGELSPGAPDQVRIHVTKLRLLKMPVKGLFGALHIKTEELFDAKGVHGITVRGDDIYLNCAEILPAPHQNGQMTDVHLANGTEIVEVYGVNARPEARAEKQWRNFVRMRGGVIRIGKMEMQDADIFMIDLSPYNWFDFDLKHYGEQISSGYARLTPQDGIQLFMSEYRKTPSSKDLGWMKNRNISPPPDVPK